MKKWVFVLLLGAGITAASPVYAEAYCFSTHVDNTIETGDISISLEEFELDERGNPVPYADGKRILPNERLSKLVRITNEAEPAWIRAKAEFIADTGMEGAEEPVLGGISDSWVQRGGYYYYTEPVETGESVSFFEEVIIPAEWDERYAAEKFSIDVTAQAIQRVHFEPQFESEDPWFGTLIETCVHLDHGIRRTGENMEFAVVFENGVEGFVKIGEDFFDNFSAMMPGDTETDTFVVGNRYSDRIPILFRTEVPGGQASESVRLLEDLELTIWCGNEMIYAGRLSGDELKDGLPLVNLRKGETETVTYQLHMPKELTNAWALQHAQVRWIFSTEYGVSQRGNDEEDRDEEARIVPFPSAAEIPVAIISETKTREGERSASGSENQGKIFDVVLPETGDGNLDMGLCILAVLGFGGGSLLLLFPWKENEEAGEEKSGEE